jgi:acyl-[acyl carrier protein]--UDP-N-acetylglucosamine O-acyltransferase
MIHRAAIFDPNAQIDGDVEIGPYVLIEGPVRIALGTQIQGHAVISGAVSIGRNTVSAINVIGLRRAGFGLALRKEAKDAFNLFYRSGLNATQAVEEAALRSWASEISVFWNFVASSKRGICSMARWSEIKGAAFQGEE